MPHAVTGHQFEISAGPYRATVTQAGAGLRELTHAGDQLILSHDADEQMTGPPDVLAGGPDLIRLLPGAEYRGSWGIVAG